MDPVIAYFAIGLVALGFAVFFAKRGKTSIADQWQRAFALAQEIVPAVEQLYLTRQIPKEQRLDMVMVELRAHFPDLEEYHLRWAIEKAVNLMNRGKIVLPEIGGESSMLEIASDGGLHITGAPGKLL